MIKITVKGTRTISATELAPPGQRPGTRLLNEARHGPLLVFMRVEALAEASERAIGADGYEVGGFLIGGLHEHDGQRYVDIRNHIPSLQAESGRAELAFTNEAQREAFRIKDRDFPDELVLGWYHSHPRYGVFLSGYDLFVHKQFFTEDWHVAVVIDPHARPPRRDAGVFLWQGEQISKPYDLAVYRGDLELG